MYNYSNFEDRIQKVRSIFYDSFITLAGELIIEPKSNTYFSLETTGCQYEFDCKMIEYLSRPSHKGLTKPLQKKIRDGLNKYFEKEWTIEDLSIIYTKLGNGVNRELCIKFIDSGFDLNILK